MLRRTWAILSTGMRLGGSFPSAAKTKGRSFSVHSKWDATLNLPKTALSVRSVLNDAPYCDAVAKQLYEAQSQRSSATPFSITDGPPFANGNLHVGHALNKFLKDTILRFKIATGHCVSFRPGWDCHGLPIELKALSSASSSTKDPLAIRQACRKFASESIEAQKQCMQEWGLLGDYAAGYLTMSPAYEANQLRVLAQMLRRGLVYSGLKPVYYSPSSRTALAEAELEYLDDYASLSAFVKFRVSMCDLLKSLLRNSNVSANDAVHLVAWTTTPWTLPANKALAVHPDAVYSLLRNSHDRSLLLIARARVPFVCASLQHGLDVVKSEFCRGKDLIQLQYCPLDWVFGKDQDRLGPRPIIGADFVREDSGSGIVHLAPNYGAEDYVVCLRHGIEPGEDLLCDDGTFNDTSPSFLHGMNVLEGASETVVEYMKHGPGHMLLASSYYQHRYPCDWRTKRPVIQRATRQWFISVESLGQELQRAIDAIRFIPEQGKQKLWQMVSARSSWCISRQRIWGVPIPALKNGSDLPLLTPENVEQFARLTEADPSGTDIWWSRGVGELFPGSALEKTFDTMDVWFDSGTAWASHGEGPSDLYLEGSDQFRGWFQSSLVTAIAATGRAPYRAILTHGFVLDSDGRKMSKSLGNVVDPRAIIGKEGSDALRLWAAASDYTSDVTIGEKTVKQAVEMKNKLRNALRFAVANLNGFDTRAQVDVNALPVLDRMALAKLAAAIHSAHAAFDSFDLSKVIQGLVAYCGQDLSGFYFDIVKDRLYTEPIGSGKRQASQQVLLAVVDSLCRVLQPLLPIMTQEIYGHYRQYLPEESGQLVSLLSWPAPSQLADSVGLIQMHDRLKCLRSEYLDFFHTQLKPSLGARSTFQVIVSLSKPVAGALGSVTVEEWRQILMAAYVEIGTGESWEGSMGLGDWLVARLSRAEKCPRCWTFASQDAEAPCFRCLEQLNSQTELSHQM